MATQMEVVEDRLKSSLYQVQVDCGVLERMVYKNKNQQRRSSYFKYLLKVRRDLKLFQSMHIENPLESCFNVITGKRTAQKLGLLDSLKGRNREVGKYTFMDRVLGAARLLSQMVEPMMKTAIEIATLLARSFFMGFSLAILALVARLRVLVQQMLVDVVAVYNEVSSISQKKQSIKITQDGIEVFRDYYPSMDEIITLECAWETDKFVLVERTTKCSFSHEHQDLGGPPGTAPVRYHSVKAFLGDEELDLSESDAVPGVEEDPTQHKKQKIDPFATLLEPSGTVAPPDRSFDVESINSSPSLSKTKSASKSKVAFISVKKPEPSAAPREDNVTPRELSESNRDRDPFFDLLTRGITKNSLF